MIDQNDLPAGWEMLPFGAITQPSKAKIDPSIARDIPYVGLEHIEAHTRRLLGNGKGADVKSTKSSFSTGDVLYGKLRPYLNKVTIAPFDGMASTDILVFPSSSRITSDYLLRLLSSSQFVELAHISSAGMELPRTSWKALQHIQLPVPSIAEQRRITATLDKIDERRDAAVSSILKAATLLKVFRRAVLDAACSGRLTEDWRESSEETPAIDLDALAKMSRRRRRHSEVMTDLEMPELPDSYVTAPLSMVATTIEYGTSRKADGSIDDVPVLRMGNIQDGSLDLNDLKYLTRDGEVERLLLQDGDLLFNRTNSPELVGKSAVWCGSKDATFASYLIRVQFHKDAAVPEFVNYWINSSWGRAWARQVKTDGVSQSNINGTKLGAMPLPLPPLEEQHEIVRRVEALLEGSAEILSKVNAASALVERAGQAALSKALRGELVEAE